MSKKVSKKLLDSMLDLSRKYFETKTESKNDILYAWTKRCKELDEATGILWLSWQDLSMAIFQVLGICPNATNFQIYMVLSVLGWEVVDE